MSAAEQWILAGTYSSGPCEGSPQYHMADTRIGPASTPDIDKAQIFESQQAAFNSSGYLHWSSFLKPVTLSEAKLAISEVGP